MHDGVRFRSKGGCEGGCAHLGGSEDILDGHGNLGANAVTLDNADREVSLWQALVVLL